MIPMTLRRVHPVLTFVRWHAQCDIRERAIRVNLVDNHTIVMMDTVSDVVQSRRDGGNLEKIRALTEN